jgi:hypothetical protein
LQIEPGENCSALARIGEVISENELPGNRKEDKVMVETISRGDLKAKIDNRDDFVLVETLPEEQYRHTHLPGAINLPPDRVRELAPELLADKEVDIVVYCGSPA